MIGCPELPFSVSPTRQNHREVAIMNKSHGLFQRCNKQRPTELVQFDKITSAISSLMMPHATSHYLTFRTKKTNRISLGELPKLVIAKILRLSVSSGDSAARMALRSRCRFAMADLWRSCWLHAAERSLKAVI